MDLFFRIHNKTLFLENQAGPIYEGKEDLKLYFDFSSIWCGLSKKLLVNNSNEINFLSKDSAIIPKENVIEGMVIAVIGTGEEEIKTNAVSIFVQKEATGPINASIVEESIVKITDSVFSKVVEWNVENLGEAFIDSISQKVFDLVKDYINSGSNPGVSLTAAELVQRIITGWNLGNTFDSTYHGSLKGTKTPTEHETFWGAPVTTKAMIDEVAQKGFNAIRIPVSWYYATTDGMMIREDFLNRVEEVVNYALANNMIVILNSHHDREAIYAELSDVDKVKQNINHIWTQIATHFKDYPVEALVFEAFNEILNKAANWTVKDTDYNALNQLSQQFVDTIRATGGKNRERILCISSIGAFNSGKAIESITIPMDVTANKIIMKVHCYNTDLTDGIEPMLVALNELFISKGVPVIIGEWGTTKAMSVQQRNLHASNFIARTRKYGVKCFWWDNNLFTSGETYGLLRRVELTWDADGVQDAIMAGLTAEPNTKELIYTWDLTNGALWEEGTFDRYTGAFIERSKYASPLGGYSTIRTIDMIPCDTTRTYFINVNSSDNGYRICTIACYNENGVFIGGKNLEWNRSFYLNPPSDVKYFKFSIHNPWNSNNKAATVSLMNASKLSVYVEEYKALTQDKTVMDVPPTTSFLYLKKSDGVGGYNVNASGKIVAASSDYCIFYLNTENLTDRNISVSCSTGGLYMAQYDKNGTLVKYHSHFKNYTGTLESGTVALAIANTWMDSNSTVTVAFELNKTIEKFITLEEAVAGKVIDVNDDPSTPYLLSHGKEYINTGILADNSTTIEIRYSLQILNSGGFLTGSRTSSTSSDRMVASLYHGGSDKLAYLYAATVNTTAQTLKDKNTHIIKLKNNEMYFDDVLVCRATEATITSKYPIYVFAGNNAGTAAYPVACKLRYCKIWKGDMLVADIVPKQENGVGQAYDQISGNYYTTLGGGTFEYGPE